MQSITVVMVDTQAQFGLLQIAMETRGETSFLTRMALEHNFGLMEALQTKI
jgi:hypothetical protein